MRSPTCALSLALCMLLFSHTARADPTKTLKDISNTVVRKAFPGIGSPFARHENIPPFIVKDKPVFLLAIINFDGSRCTNNFTVEDKYRGVYTCYVTEVPKTTLLRTRFQRKGDKKGFGIDNLSGEDATRGDSFRAGSSVTLDGTHNYLAERDFDAGRVLAEYPYAMIVLVPGGLTLDDVLDAMLALEDKK